MEEQRTRQEQVRWAKDRALALLDSGQREEALTSLAGDFLDNPDTEGLVNEMTGMLFMIESMFGNDDSTRRFIAGFQE